MLCQEGQEMEGDRGGQKGRGRIGPRSIPGERGTCPCVSIEIAGVK